MQLLCLQAYSMQLVGPHSLGDGGDNLGSSGQSLVQDSTNYLLMSFSVNI